MAKPTLGKRNTDHSAIVAWVEETADLCRPDRVFWCDGSEREKETLTAQAMADGVLTQLNQQKLPGGYYHRSNPNDVARVEQCTFICTPTRAEAGPTNNWAPPAEMRRKLDRLLEGAMRGRTLYVIPYLMGPPGSPLAKMGVEVTDSIYVVLSMRIMARMGQLAYEHLGERADFNRGLHAMLDIHPERRYICHFPQDNQIISVGSAYGGNVLLGKKCLALRIGSYLGRHEGWMAEHMLILGVESPDGRKTFVAAAFPSACGKTNFAMLIPPAHYQGWKVTTVGDDICWMKPGADGRLYAINPEAGYFGVVPGTNSRSNPNAVKTIARDSYFTNVALTPDLDVWWEGKDGPIPAVCRDWRGQEWTPASPDRAAHPNSRFTAPMRNNPALAPEIDDPHGVPISALIFGGRRATTLPLVFEAFDWIHGVYLGATMASEMTAAAAGAVGRVRRDPMAMLPFAGYDMGNYFKHWLNMRKRIARPPRIFHVNWFRKDPAGKFLWPGYGDNMRVLRWILDRCHGRVGADEGALGWMPRLEDFDLANLPGFGADQFAQLQAVHPEEWQRELASQDELFQLLRRTLPRELVCQRELLASRLAP
jgi:phosphoenolpyruvate carboxykinase (GTP)